MKQVPVPIPLTCISCKLLEHILASNTMKQLESNNILFEFQHGFRENRFCESHIIFMIHLLTYNKDENIQTALMIIFKYTYRAPLRRIGQEYSANVAFSTSKSLKRTMTKGKSLKKRLKKEISLGKLSSWGAR
jgi:hypothetical protein